MIQGYDSRPGLRQIDRPVLIVQGHQDPVATRPLKTFTRRSSRSVLTYVNQCGHFPWLEQPDDFRRILAEFFTSTAREK